MTQGPEGSPASRRRAQRARQNTFPTKTPSKSPSGLQLEHIRPNVSRQKSSESLTPKGELKATPPSPKFMFIPMSTEPGARAKIQRELRASAKAHVMHDYQRKTAQSRNAVWKMSTPTTFPLAPRQPAATEPKTCHETANPQALVRRENTGITRQESRHKKKPVISPTKLISSDDTGIASQQTLSSSFSYTRSNSQFIQYTAPTIPTQPIDSTHMDVFSALPISVNPWDETLILRWLNYDRIPWCPINGQSRWIPFVVRSPMLLHTNLYCWGMHFHGKLTGVASEKFLHENPRILEHKIAAIQMINAQIANQSYDFDEILAAVSIFINIELAFQTRDEAARHMAGLEALLAMRGGLHSLSTIGEIGTLLQRIISWNDLFFVELFGGHLRFTHLPRWEEAWRAAYAPIMDDPVTHLEPLQARFAGNLAQEITTLLREIQVMCDDIQARPLGTLTTAEKTLRHDALFRFERRLCLATRIMTFLEEDATVHGEGDSMWRAVASAALMYVHHHLRGHALHWPQFSALLVQMRDNISLMAESGWNAAPALQIWVLAVGSVASQGQAWTVNQLAKACRSRACLGWNAFEGMLKACPYLGAADEGKFRRVWDLVVPLLA